jgi:hypothetical protein
MLLLVEQLHDWQEPAPDSSLATDILQAYSYNAGTVQYMTPVCCRRREQGVTYLWRTDWLKAHHSQLAACSLPVVHPSDRSKHELYFGWSSCSGSAAATILLSVKRMHDALHGPHIGTRRHNSCQEARSRNHIISNYLPSPTSAVVCSVLPPMTQSSRHRGAGSTHY